MGKIIINITLNMSDLCIILHNIHLNRKYLKSININDMENINVIPLDSSKLSQEK